MSSLGNTTGLQIPKKRKYLRITVEDILLVTSCFCDISIAETSLLSRGTFWSLSRSLVPINHCSLIMLALSSVVTIGGLSETVERLMDERLRIGKTRRIPDCMGTFRYPFTFDNSAFRR